MQVSHGRSNSFNAFYPGPRLAVRPILGFLLGYEAGYDVPVSVGVRDTNPISVIGALYGICVHA